MYQTRFVSDDYNNGDSNTAEMTATAEVITMEVYSGSHSQSVQTGDNANVIMWAVLCWKQKQLLGHSVIRRKNK